MLFKKHFFKKWHLPFFDSRPTVCHCSYIYIYIVFGYSFISLLARSTCARLNFLFDYIYTHPFIILFLFHPAPRFISSFFIFPRKRIIEDLPFNTHSLEISSVKITGTFFFFFISKNFPCFSQCQKTE